jgi:hypothetical protein
MKTVLAAVAATFVAIAALIDNYDQRLSPSQKLERVGDHVATLKNEARTVTTALFLLQPQNLVRCVTLRGGEKTPGESARYPDDTRSYRHEANAAARSDCLHKFDALSGSSSISLPRHRAPRAFLKRQARPAKKVTAAAGADALRTVKDLGLTA